MAAVFSTQEVALVNQIFAKHDHQKFGVITGDRAVNIFGGANLKAATLGQIWDIADVDHQGFLNRKGVFIAVRLIGWAQEGLPVSAELVNKPGPIPIIDGLGSTEYLVMPSVPNASEIEVAGSELERITELQQLLSEALAVQTEQDRCLAEVRAELEAKKSELEAVRSRVVNGFTESRAEAETGSLQDRVTLLWQNKYEALAKLYSQLRTEHLDLLSSYKEWQLKENAKTTAETGSSQDRDTLPRNEYDALAKLCNQIRTEQLDLLSTCKELQLKASAQTTAGSSQDQITLLRNEYDALSKQHGELRTEHLDMLSKHKELQLKANAQTTAGVVNIPVDEERIILRLMERMKYMETEMASLKSSEKSFEMMECRNEG